PLCNNPNAPAGQARQQRGTQARQVGTVCASTTDAACARCPADSARGVVTRQYTFLAASSPSRGLDGTLTKLKSRFSSAEHEAQAQQQHPLPYSFTDFRFAIDDFRLEENVGDAASIANRKSQIENLLRSLDEQKHRFEGLVDQVVPIDLTPVEEGFNEPNYG